MDGKKEEVNGRENGGVTRCVWRWDETGCRCHFWVASWRCVSGVEDETTEHVKSGCMLRFRQDVRERMRTESIRWGDLQLRKEEKLDAFCIEIVNRWGAGAVQQDED